MMFILIVDWANAPEFIPSFIATYPTVSAHTVDSGTSISSANSRLHEFHSSILSFNVNFFSRCCTFTQYRGQNICQSSWSCCRSEGQDYAVNIWVVPILLDGRVSLCWRVCLHSWGYVWFVQIQLLASCRWGSAKWPHQGTLLKHNLYHIELTANHLVLLALQNCMLKHKADMEVSFAIAQSKEKSCGICMETIWDKQPSAKQRFGILPNCSHCFCLDCIRKWRQEKQFENKIVRYWFVWILDKLVVILVSLWYWKLGNWNFFIVVINYKYTILYRAYSKLKNIFYLKVNSDPFFFTFLCSSISTTLISNKIIQNPLKILLTPKLAWEFF